jgi:hypothetical protein
MKTSAIRIERLLEEFEARLVPPPRPCLSIITHEGEDDEAEAMEKALAEHIAAHPEDAGRTVKDFRWVVWEIVHRPQVAFEISEAEISATEARNEISKGAFEEADKDADGPSETLDEPIDLPPPDPRRELALRRPLRLSARRWPIFRPCPPAGWARSRHKASEGIPQNGLRLNQKYTASFRLPRKIGLRRLQREQQRSARQLGRALINAQITTFGCQEIVDISRVIGALRLRRSVERGDKHEVEAKDGGLGRTTFLSYRSAGHSQT